MVSVLRLAKNATNIELSLNDTEKLNIVVNTTYDNKNFNLKLFNSNDEDEMDMGDCDYTCSIDMSPNIYSEIITGCTVMESDSISFTIKNNKLNIQAEGAIGDFSHLFNNNTIEEKEEVEDKETVKKGVSLKSNNYKIYDCTGSFKLEFSLRYFKFFNKASSLSNNVSINLIEDNPIRLDYLIGDNGSILQYYLAPKISDD